MHTHNTKHKFINSESVSSFSVTKHPRHSCSCMLQQPAQSDASIVGLTLSLSKVHICVCVCVGVTVWVWVGVGGTALIAAVKYVCVCREGGGRGGTVCVGVTVWVWV